MAKPDQRQALFDAAGAAAQAIGSNIKLLYVYKNMPNVDQDRVDNQQYVVDKLIKQLDRIIKQQNSLDSK